MLQFVVFAGYFHALEVDVVEALLIVLPGRFVIVVLVVSVDLVEAFDVVEEAVPARELARESIPIK